MLEYIGIIVAIVYCIGLIAILCKLNSMNRALLRDEEHVESSAIILASLFWPVTLFYISYIYLLGEYSADFEDGEHRLRASHRKQRGRTAPDYTYGEQQCPHCRAVNSRPLNDSKTLWRCIQCNKIFSITNVNEFEDDCGCIDD